MSQIHQKESFISSAAHRTVWVFSCFLNFFLNNVIFSVCFFVFWLIYSGLKGVRKVKESRRIFFFTSFLPLLSPERSLIL